MNTLIVKFDPGNKAVLQVLHGLSDMGAIVIEKPMYDEDFVKKIARGDHDLKAGKGQKIDPAELWM